MINVIHDNGTSFKGLLAYLMHDKGAATAERVAWTETHNLATHDPETAWRVMAATAKRQGELKRAAGIGAAGRKSAAVVMHYTLSWHAEERGSVSRDEMIAAAMASMTFLGTNEGEKLGKKKKALRTQFADEHQAIIVCHTDTAQPHVHVVLNRVHPDHGVMLPDSKDYEKLSAWALKYRRAQGKEQYCPERVKNAAARAQGLLTSHRRKPRNQFELEEQQQAVDPASRKAAILQELKRRAAMLTARSARQKQQHQEAVHQLETDHLHTEQKVRAKTDERFQAARAKIATTFRAKLDRLSDRQDSERRAIEKAQTSLRGRVRNSWEAIKAKTWMRDVGRKPLRALTQAFKLAFSSGLQQQQLGAMHAEQRRELDLERRRAERQAKRELRLKERNSLKAQRRSYAVARSDVLFKQDMERAKLKAEWRQLQNDRSRAFGDHERSPATLDREPLKSEFNKAADRSSDATAGGGGRQSDRNKLIEEFERQIRQRLEGIERGGPNLDEERGR